jgi:hypothetical protein
MMKEKVKRALYLQFYGTLQFSCQKVRNFELNCEQITGVVLTKTANTKREERSFYLIYLICSMERVQVH